MTESLWTPGAGLGVRKFVHGKPVNNADALVNHKALDWYRGHPELHD